MYFPPIHKSHFKPSLIGSISEFFFFLSDFHTKIKQHSLPYYLYLAGERILRFIPFPSVLALCEILISDLNSNHRVHCALFNCCCIHTFTKAKCITKTLIKNLNSVRLKTITIFPDINFWCCQYDSESNEKCRPSPLKSEYLLTFEIKMTCNSSIA